jgi:hypothetical protein
MSPLTGQTDQAVRAIAAERRRAAGRARRAEAAGITAMARSILRDAREARRDQASCDSGAVGAPERSAAASRLARRRRAGGGSPRLSPSPLAARHA